MASWKIVEWSRERARGVIASGIGRLPFDASVADVDDFVVGEAVGVKLARAGYSFRVLRLWPDVPRFKAAHVNAGIPALSDEAARSANPALAALDLAGRTAYVEKLDEQALTMTVNRISAYDRDTVATFVQPSYVELQIQDGIDIRFIRLADAQESAYLATRTELSARHIAITIIDETRRFGFVVCHAIKHDSLA